MIVAWKRVSPLELAAQWQGMDLSLKWNQEAVPPRWRLTIDGALVKQNWPDVRTAQTEIDNVILKLVMQAARGRLVNGMTLGSKEVASV
jgi:hypothetical protein